MPGLGIATTALGVLLVGALATNVIGKRFLQRGESYLLRVPVFRTIYAPVKQLVVAFSPDNEFGFKQVVLLEHNAAVSLGFLTKEFSVDRGRGPEPMIAVYVPTNHLYLGDIVVAERSRATFPDITVEEGIRIFLTGGMALPERMRGRRADDRAPAAASPASVGVERVVDHLDAGFPGKILQYAGGHVPRPVVEVHRALLRPAGESDSATAAAPARRSERRRRSRIAATSVGDRAPRPTGDSARCPAFRLSWRSRNAPPT